MNLPLGKSWDNDGKMRVGWGFVNGIFFTGNMSGNIMRIMTFMCF